MKTKPLLAMLALSVGVLSMTARLQAQPNQLPEPLYARDFETDVGGWAAIGKNGNVSQTREGTKAGTGALQFDYEVENGVFSALVTPLAAGALSTLQALTFDLKSDHDMSLMVVLTEQGGGRFMAPISLAADKWQSVELAPDDFILQTNPDDPKDANGKLDLDKIESLGLVDFNQLLVQGDVNNPLLRLLDIVSGPRILWLDKVRLSSKPLPEIPKIETPENSINLDAFLRPQVSWIGIGNISLELAKAELPANNALQVKYQQAAGRISALIKPLAPRILTGKKQLDFQIASEKTAVLMVQLEETSGGKYNVTIPVAGDVKPKIVEADFSDFKPAQDSKDDNTQLDLDQVKQILILDAAGMAGIGKGDNTLWLGRISAK